MAYYNFESVTQSEQMYLITIARLIEQGCPEPIPLSDNAKQLSIMPVSVNQKVRKLEWEGLLNYLPYKGVALTPQGQAIASRILRKRRLWEVFLVDQLKLSMEAADDMACSLEHFTTNDVAQRLSHLLGDPEVNPQGQQIPPLQGDQAIRDWIRLTHLEVIVRGRIENLEIPSAASRFLIEEGLRPGSEVAIKAIGAQGSRLVEIAGSCMELSHDLADQIWITHSTPK